MPAPAPRPQRRPTALPAASTHGRVSFQSTRGGMGLQPMPPHVPAASPAPCASQRQRPRHDAPPAAASQKLTAETAGAASTPAAPRKQRQPLQHDASAAAAGPSVGQRLLAGVAGAALALGALLGGQGDVLAPPPAAHAITTQQLLFLEAWRAVDRAYVDKGFNGQTWFRVREQYLKNVRVL
eukprot:308094-Chlamydomonas_euryale.AAC.1